MSWVRNTRMRVLCICLVLFVFISGIHMDEGNRDSVFVRASAQMEHSCILYENDGNTVAVTGCTGEMLGIHQDIGCKPCVLKYSDQKRDAKLLLSFLCPAFFSLNGGKSYGKSEETSLIYDSQKELLADYIHRSDGKKKV